MEKTHDISPRQDAHTKYELAYFANSMAIGGLVRGEFDVERIQALMHELEEATFEAIEAGCFSEIEGLQQLLQELESNSSALRYHRLSEIATETDERIEAVERRMAELFSEQYPTDNYGY
jgi:gamma-glutamyl:cysteine ligase YbdK (ATP-grasp superfamily)